MQEKVQMDRLGISDCRINLCSLKFKIQLQGALNTIVRAIARNKAIGYFITSINLNLFL